MMRWFVDRLTGIAELDDDAVEEDTLARPKEGTEEDEEDGEMLFEAFLAAPMPPMMGGDDARGGEDAPDA